MRALFTLGLLSLAVPAAATVESAPLGGFRAEVAALLVQGVAGGSLPVAAAVFPAPAAADGGSGLLLLVELPASPAGDDETDRPLEVYAYAVDEGGEVAAHWAVGLPSWPKAGEGVKILGRLKAPPGALSLRVLAWDPIARRYGMVVRELVPGDGPPAPRIVERCPQWQVAGDEAPELAGFSARPVLVAGETQRLALEAAARPGDWRVRLEGDGTTRTGPAEAEVVVEAPGELQFVVPDLPAGVYRLTVAAAGEDSWSSPPVDSWLVSALPPAEEGCARSWSRVLRLARAGASVTERRPAPRAEEARAGSRKALRRLAAGYLEELGRLAATGDLRASARRLAELEKRLVGDDPTRISPLSAAELQAARTVGERDPRCLLPLIALHAETYRVHHAAGSFYMASHSRRQAAEIAELAAARLDTPEELALISVGLASLADMVQTRRASIEAQRLLERALELDEGHEAARLLLAVSYERKGRYDDARRQLETLVAANSAHHEARVRLAILLRRIGEAATAERLLRTVVAERPPAWLLSLGYQTLAQLLIREARFGEAVSEIRRALDRLPDDQALEVLLAYALDRSGERRAVRETLDALTPSAGPATPRYRYSDEPAAALGLLRETLRQSVTVRLPVLALALDRVRPGGDGR